MNTIYNTNKLELYHHGVLGMHWGVRRYQPYTAGYDAEGRGRFVGSNRSRVKSSGRRQPTATKKYRAQKPVYNENKAAKTERSRAKKSLKTGAKLGLWVLGVAGTAAVTGLALRAGSSIESQYATAISNGMSKSLAMPTRLLTEAAITGAGLAAIKGIWSPVRKGVKKIAKTE